LTSEVFKLDKNKKVQNKEAEREKKMKEFGKERRQNKRD